MSSKRDDGLVLPRLQEGTHDAAATLCAFLLARRGWSRSRVALTFGISPLVVEECIRSGVSSTALRSQLALWIAENKDDSLPRELVRSVVEAAALSSADAPECLQDDDFFCALDPAAHSYFAELGSSVGQSFISILNDPLDTAEASGGWGFWLGGLLSSGVENKWQTKRAETGGTSGPLSEVLLARYGLQEDYSSYFQLVSASYDRNCEEGRLKSGMTGAGERVDANGGVPWPSCVPEEFFTSSHDSSGEVRLLEQEQQERKGNGECGREGTPMTLESFGEDFEVMESRMKALRQWETDVEGCLVQHVQGRSEQFFAISHEFGDRTAEARATLEDLQRTREDIGRFGKGLVREMMMIARRYRRRNNLDSLRNLVEMVVAISSRVEAVENWVALPERDMVELPAVVESFCALQDVLGVGAGTEASLTNTSSPEMGWISRVTALKDVPNRVMLVRQRLSTMIMEQLKMVLLFSPHGGGDDNNFARAFLSAVKLGIWPMAMEHCRDLLVASLWTTVRETFIAFLMGQCDISNSTANALLSTAVTADAPREERMKLFSYSNACRFVLYTQLVGIVVDHILGHVRQAAQRWGLLLVEAVSGFFASKDKAISMEDTKKYLSSLCVTAESVFALLLEVRSQDGKAPTNVHELETLVSMGCAFLRNMTDAVQGVLEISGNVGDPWTFVSGKRLKSALTRLAKEHFRLRHVESMEKMRVTIENETWQPEEIDVASQSCVDMLCCGDAASIEELQARALFTDVMTDNGICSVATTGATATLATSPNFLDSSGANLRKQPRLLLPSVDGHTDGRVVSGSFLLLVELLREYDGYLGRFPFLAFDVMGKIYDLLKLYVAQCGAVLLGGIAVERGVLRTITAQHMAVASQNLTFLHNSIPFIQKRWLCATAVDKLSPSVVDDMERVRKDCVTCRGELFRKISGLVKEKVDGLGTVVAGQWRTSGNEWVMTMLRETARLMRALKPLLPAEDCCGIVVPLLGTFARMIRSVTMSPEVDAGIQAVMLSDVLLFKANVERFGFDVLRCAALCMSEAEMTASSLEPCSSEATVIAWFFSSA